MTAEALVVEVFEKHWLVTTILFPYATFLYAWITDQPWWVIGSFFFMTVDGIKYVRLRRP